MRVSSRSSSASSYSSPTAAVALSRAQSQDSITDLSKVHFTPLLHTTGFPVEQPAANANALPLFMGMTARAAAAAAGMVAIRHATPPSTSCPNSPSPPPPPAGPRGEPRDSFAARMAGRKLAPAAMLMRSLPAAYSLSAGDGVNRGMKLRTFGSARGFPASNNALPRVRSEPTMTGLRRPGGQMTDLQRLGIVVRLATGGRPLDEAMRTLRARISELRSAQQPSGLTVALPLMTDLQRMAYVLSRAATGCRALSEN